MDSVRKGNGEGKRGGLLHGVAWLTVAGLAAKVLGFLYKVPLNAILGDEMANVNAAYAVYAVLYTVSTAGIPSAVSLSVSSARAAGDGGRVRAVFRVTMTTLLAVGAVLTALLSPVLVAARPTRAPGSATTVLTPWPGPGAWCLPAFILMRLPT